MKYILGVDGGGTKTLAAVADMKGRVLGLARTGGSNFQAWGTVRAGIEINDAIDSALKIAGIGREKIAFATYGIAGADRDKDFDTVLSYVEPVNPAPCFMITNDTTIALRAGTDAGVGVALIGGTGSNVIGFSADYAQRKVDGHGRLTGDYGSAQDIALKGIVAALKYWDGRGPRTALYEMLCRRIGVEDLIDIIEFEYIDKFSPLHLGDFAPVVFKAANAGDKVALRILRDTGRQVGRDAVACIRQLFKKGDIFTVVLAGSVYQRGENPVLVKTLTEFIKRRYSGARVVQLKHEPCLGALLWSADSILGKPAPKALARGMAESFAEAFQKLHGEGEK